MTGSVFEENGSNDTLTGGGGIYTEGNSTIRDCTFTNNLATRARGGGIRLEKSNNLVSNCLFVGNRADYGGGLYSLFHISRPFAPSLVEKCQFIGNEANAGGGIGADNPGLTVKDCVVISNSAKGGSLDLFRGGGGIDSNNGGNFLGCVITGNTCKSEGGGINSFSRPTFENCLIENNRSEMEGGGCRTVQDATFRYCTFVNNAASLGNEIVADQAFAYPESGADPIVANCVVWSASPNPIVELGTSIVHVSYSNISGGWPGEGNIDADPLFVDPPKGNFRLLSNSPCIDNASAEGPPTDFEGNPRPVDVVGRGTEGPGAFDMGAYEFQIPAGDLNSNGVFEPLDLFIFGRDWMKATDVSGREGRSNGFGVP